MEPGTMIRLEEGEVVIHDEGASYFHNFIAVGGHLKLTNRRLIFCSNACNHYQHSMVLTLSDITGIEFFKTMLINPNGMALMLQNGSLENFIVDDRKAWRERIMSMISQVA